MPTTSIEIPQRVDPPRKRWTRAEVESLSTSALAGERLELVEGELVSKMGKKRPHVNALVLLLGWLVQEFGLRFVNPEAPIDVAPEDNPSSEPEPDLVVLSRDLTHFQTANPRPSDLLLVVEISDTTLGFDLTTKARLYARARIAEYWCVDIISRRLIVHRDPQLGQYRSVVAYSESESVAPLAKPDAYLLVSSVFAR